MYNGDRARKMNLVDYGFRLPSALDNRPLKFEEFENKVSQVVYVSATPGPYEIRQSLSSPVIPAKAGIHGSATRNTKGSLVGELDPRIREDDNAYTDDLRNITVVEQIIRPTGLIDPTIEIKPIKNQVDDLLEQIIARTKNHERVLVTTLTKRMAEELTEYLKESNIKVQYIHSEVETFERLEILRDLRLGVFDVLVGINLFREGLDLPEVSLVAILDADKEGFLRSTRSLIQTMGRAARHINGKAILYADRLTNSMREAIGETERRRQKQVAYNEAHGITPKGIIKAVKEIIDGATPAHPLYDTRNYGSKSARAGHEFLRAAEEEAEYAAMAPSALAKLLDKLEKQMYAHARNLEFEKAAALRDKIHAIRSRRFGVIEGGARKRGR